MVKHCKNVLFNPVRYTIQRMTSQRGEYTLVTGLFLGWEGKLCLLILKILIGYCNHFMFYALFCITLYFKKLIVLKFPGFNSYI